MWTKDQWVMTSHGPVQIERLLDRPHTSVSHEGDTLINYSGYTLRDFRDFVTIRAQGHELKIGRDHPVYLADQLPIPAGDIREGQSIEMRPQQNFDWHGAGGSDSDGELMGYIVSNYQPDDTMQIQRYLVDTLSLNFLETGPAEEFLNRWIRRDKIEQSSTNYYKGFLRAAVLDHVEYDGVYFVNYENAEPNIPQVLRMLMRIGVFAYMVDDQIVLPSYSLRHLILQVGFGNKGADLFPQVENITVPQTYEVQVDSVKHDSFPDHLYGTDGICAKIEVNCFTVYTEG